MDELIIKIKIISKPLSYWQTNDPIIPLGQAAHVTDNAQSQVRIGDGSTKWSLLKDKNIDMSVPHHASAHTASGGDALTLTIGQISDFRIATDAEITAGTNTKNAVNPAQLKASLDTLKSNVDAEINSVQSDFSTRLDGVQNSLSSSITAVANNNAASIAALTNRVHNITISSAGPSGGSNGDIWLQYLA